MSNDYLKNYMLEHSIDKPRNSDSHCVFSKVIHNKNQTSNAHIDTIGSFTSTPEVTKKGGGFVSHSFKRHKHIRRFKRTPELSEEYDVTEIDIPTSSDRSK